MTMVWLGGAADAFLNSAPAPHAQDGPFSCWACGARHIYGFKKPTGTPRGKFAAPNIDSDLDFSKSVGLPLKLSRPLIFILAEMGYGVAAEKKRIPHIGEIETAIAAGTALVSCIGDDVDRKTGGVARDLEFENGHWVVIVGVDTASGEVAVFEPFSGSVHVVAFHKQRCNIPGYEYCSWQNTSYID